MSLLAATALIAQLHSAAPVSAQSLTAEDSLRYETAWLPKRVLYDLAQLPLDLGKLNRREAAFFALYTYSVVALMVPDHHSLDARMQFTLNADLGQPRPQVWTRDGDALIWSSISGALVGQWLYGFIADQPLRMQMVSLMVEALAVSQLYHLAFKLSTGREGPNNGTGAGLISGPGLRAFRQFPAGTPSGHATSAYALLAVAVSFIEQPWARVAIHLGALAFAVSLVVDNYHFVSDVLWGAALGYGVGRWVAQHRASRGVTRWYADITVVPLVDPWRQGGGIGIFFPSPI